MRNQIKHSLFVLLGLMGFKALPAQAASDIFLCISDNDKIPGESLDKIHKDCIDVLAWSWGSSQSGTTHAGAGSGTGKVSVQDISITKFVDLASAPLLEKVTRGDIISEFDLIVRKAGSCTGGPGCTASGLEYITINVKNILVSSASTGGSGGEERLTENVTFNFSEYEYCYTPQTDSGAAGEQKCWAWDIAANTVP